MRDLLAQVSGQTNIDFRNYKSSTILRRISRRMAVTHNDTVRDYSNYLRTHPDEVHELIKAFLIKVTGFFRDPEAFDFLRSTVVPELIERNRDNGRILRLWSAGCATGEEAYSLGILIADQLGQGFSEWNVKIFATDLSAESIIFARRGLYPENVLQDLPGEYRERFFERVDHGYQVTKALRQAVIFGQQDLNRGVPFPRINLVSCRNLLIYLRPELQQVVLDLFAYSLQQSQGYLFLGKAETARPTRATFELVNKKWKIYRCLAGPLHLTVHNASLSHPTGADSWREPRRRQLVGPMAPPPLDITQAEVETAQLRRINETILRYTSVAVVIIDRSYRILTINATARRLLGILDPAYDQDFLHALRGLPYHEVRRAIDNAFREHATMKLSELELSHPSEGSGHYVNLTVMIMQVENGALDLAVITVHDITEEQQLKKRLEGVQGEHAELVGELSTTNKRFLTMNKELQDANEELQATNEELMLTQEELQATNEEFEATNEELQATNEELETNNEELQATNEELQTTNDELSFRTAELQDITRQYRIEQLQLSVLLERFPHYVMVLNAGDFTIQAVNPAYKHLFAGRDVKGLTIGDIFTGKDVDQLMKLISNVVENRQSIKSGPLLASVREIEHNSDRFVHTIVPITDVNSSSVDRLFIYSERAE